MSDKEYNSVSDLIRETFDDESFADSFDEQVRHRTVVKQLMALRAARGMSQLDIAGRIGCSQSRVSKLEAGKDEDLKLGDLAGYAGAIGLNVGLAFMEKDQSLVGQVKAHAFKIQSLLDELASLAQKDDRIAQGVSGFLGEAFFNLLRMLQDSAEKMPSREDGTPMVKIEMVDASFLSEGEQESVHNLDEEPAV